MTDRSTTRRWRRILLAAAMLAAVPVLCAAERGHDPPAEATALVHANTFDPERVEVAIGGTVTWQVLEDDHTIVADDGRFDYRGEDGSTIAAGSTRAYTFGSQDEVVRYYCSVHGGPGGQGMSGVIVVGHPQAPVAETPVVRVPDDAATIAEAVATVPLWGRVEIAPGTYRLAEPVVAERTGITIAGMGDEPSDVRLEFGGRLPDVAIEMRGSHQSIRNLHIGPMRTAGVAVRDANAAAVVDVVVDGDGTMVNGILIEDTTGAAVLDGSIRGVRRAGVRVEPCAACGVVVGRTEITASLVGVLTTGARGVRIVDSRIAENGAGVVARSNDQRPSTIEIRGSRFIDNDALDIKPDVTHPDRRLASAAGIWLDGVAESSVVGNVVSGHGFGIVLSGGLAETTTIADNVVDRSADADLAWDGIGHEVCFRGHGPDATSEPSRIETLYPCDRPTVGVPYPPVAAHLWLQAYS